MLYSCVAGGIVLWFKSFLRNRVDIWLDKVISPDFFSWGYCLCIRSGIWWLPLHFQPSVPLILLKTSDLYAVCAGSQMPYAVNFWSHEGRSYSWKWSRRKACSFVQWDKACCVFCFWCLKDVFFFLTAECVGLKVLNSSLQKLLFQTKEQNNVCLNCPLEHGWECLQRFCDVLIQEGVLGEVFRVLFTKSDAL